MRFQPNIDATGQRHRRVAGLVSGAAGVGAAIWALAEPSVLAWAVAAVGLVFGAICLIQAQLKFCFARACGIKTKY